MHKVTIEIVVADADDKEDVKCFMEEIFDDYLSSGDIEELKITDIVDMDEEDNNDDDNEEEIDAKI